jgi:cysteine-rich repeat protein
LALALLVAREAPALTACTAADIIAQETACPASGACTISKVFTVGDGCVLDFSGRLVTMTASARFDIDWAAVILRVDSLTMAPGAYIDGRGLATTAPGNRGGAISISASGDVTLQKSGATRARIEVSANKAAGFIDIDAGGSITMNGKLEAAQLTSGANGGRISMDAGGNITSGPGSELTATGGSLSELGGGTVDLGAGGTIQLGDVVDVSGGRGGTIDLGAAGDIAVNSLRGNGTGDSGAAGTLTLVAGGGVQILGQVVFHGSGYNASSGGEGGAIAIVAQFGDLQLAQDINVEGSDPDGDGGQLDIDVRGAMNILKGATVSARSNGGAGEGGTISITVGTALTTAALIDASGGAAGGDIEIDVGGDAVIGADIDGSGRSAEGAGGDIAIEAGAQGGGTLTIKADVDVSGGGCDSDGCGDAGNTDLRSCNLTVTTTGRVVARAPGAAGRNQLTAREQLRIDGTVTATKTISAGVDGLNQLFYPTRRPPVIRVNGVVPAAIAVGLATCSSTVITNCLLPCPTCGNGVIEYPETCDDGGRLSCDGCSAFCDQESCEPSCVAACDPAMGCPPPPASPCPDAPTATPTLEIASPTPTVTLPPGAPTHSATAMPTPTPTATATASITNTPTSTQTPTPSATRTATNTPQSRYDAVVFAPHPPLVTLRGDSVVTKNLLVRVANGATADATPRPLHLVAADGDCPIGTIDGLPDLDAALPGAQDTVQLAGGRSAIATVPLRISAALFRSLNKKSPQRCTLTFEVAVPLAGNLDPSPDNNFLTTELNVVDLSDADPYLAHQTAVTSSLPLRVTIRRGKSEAQRQVRASVTNADSYDVAGHAITLEASDGDCPTGTMGLPIFHKPNAVPQNNAAVKNKRTRRGKIPLTIRAGDFAGGTAKSPRRCTALLLATGPSGDLDVSNNVTLLQIDVVQQ